MSTLSSVTFASLLADGRERARFAEAVRSVGEFRHLFVGAAVLDYGASWGTSLVAMLEHGAKSAVGVEIDGSRVAEGRRRLAAAGYGDRATLHHTPDTTALRFPDGAFPFVLVSAVLEHIPQPRAAYLREIWRLVAPGGHLLVRETPNKYFPKEMHTTGLWGNHWLPSAVAHRRAVRRGRFRVDRTDWASSGWRGLGYWEMVAPLSGYRLHPERSAIRHRVLSFLGLPASLLDPYPVWVLQKVPFGLPG